jgi:hypothetical protein
MGDPQISKSQNTRYLISESPNKNPTAHLKWNPKLNVEPRRRATTVAVHCVEASSADILPWSRSVQHVWGGVLVRVRSWASVKSSSSEGATERAGLLACVWFWPVASWDIIVVHCVLRNCYLGNVWVILSHGVVSFSLWALWQARVAAKASLCAGSAPGIIYIEKPILAKDGEHISTSRLKSRLVVVLLRVDTLLMLAPSLK